MKHEDTSNQESGQEKPVIRRDKVVVTKVTEQELSQIKSTAGQCGMTRSDFIRARALNYRPRQRLSVTEVDGLRQLAACRTCSPHRRRTATRQGQRTERQRRMPYDSQGKIH